MKEKVGGGEEEREEGKKGLKHRSQEGQSFLRKRWPFGVKSRRRGH